MTKQISEQDRDPTGKLNVSEPEARERVKVHIRTVLKRLRERTRSGP
jgi:hypothetical protein